MGYGYIIRVGVDSTDGLTKESLLKAYEKFLKNNKKNNIEFFFGCDGHGGSGWLSCGGLSNYRENLFKFTSEFPNTTFTFYNHMFDYASYDIVIIKNKKILHGNEFDLDDCECDPSTIIDILGSYKIKYKCNNDNYSTIQNLCNPRNHIIKNEITPLFSDSKNKIIGGFCFNSVFGNIGEYIRNNVKCCLL
jgi:hypothetical protein